MAQKRTPRKTNAGQQAAPAQTSDSFANFMTRTGVQAGNLSGNGQYTFDLISRNRMLLEAAYRSSWIVGAVVDTFAEDMTREGVEIKSDIVDPDTHEKIARAVTALQIWPALTDTIKWSRLYGGALAVMLIDGQKPETPLRLDTIGKDQFKGLLVLDRWQVQPQFNQFVQDLGPDLGKPIFYNVITDSQGQRAMKIHYTRVIRLDGVKLPYYQRMAENGWGQSVAERLWDRLVAFDSATQGAAQLVYKAHLRTMKVKGLRDIVAAGGKMMEGLAKQVEMIRAYQSNEGMTLLDGTDEFETHTYTFSGLSDMLLQFGQQISGATGIPLVRLFGQSPAGLNSTGDSDWRNYYDNVKREQEAALRTGVGKIYNAVFRSVTGNAPPENFDFSFRSLWEMDDTEKSDINTKVTDSVDKAYTSGIIDRATGLKELRKSSQVTGYWSNITDEMITAAENEPPPMPEGQGDPEADPNAKPASDEKETG